MPELTFVTGNSLKFNLADITCSQYGIMLKQAIHDIDEVQSEDAEYIARKKAEAAFSQAGAPVIVSGDSWLIPGLGGFPGPYMKSVNHWFSPADFLNLTRGLTDRRTVLVQVLAYHDEQGQKVFRKENLGEILHEARGGGNEPWAQIVTMAGDDGKTIAETYLQRGAHDTRKAAAVWHDFAAWYKEYTA